MKLRFSIFDFRLLAGILLLVLAVGILRFGVGPGAAQETKLNLKPGSETVDPLTEIKVVEQVRAATTAGLEYLRSKQQPNGSWHTSNAVNALALLAYMGRGHTPGRGPYRDVLEKGKKYLLSTANPTTGFLGPSSMYEHGLATLCLAEMYGMDADPDLELKLRPAVELIVKCQSPAGGWRYSPTPGDQDLSVTVMQIVALRAANNAEIPVPAQTIDKAIAYVRSCSSPAGGFGYTGPGQGPQTTAAGILSLQLLGKYDDTTIPKALDYMAQIPIQWSPGGPTYFYYFHYYAIQANYQAGGKYWDGWHPRIRDLLLKEQYKLDKDHADRSLVGSWDLPPGTAERNSVDPSRAYSTAMACVILDIYMHFLPAYQR